MKISIITPCYNAEKYIDETIESVISQRGNFEIEYIIVDGGSDDKTISIVEKYKRLINLGQYSIRCNDVTITSISEEDSGMYDALVKGLNIVIGDVVAYINSDDFYLPNAFSTVVEIFKTYPDVEWLTGMPVCYTEKGQIWGCSLPFKYNRTLIRKGIYGSILPFIQQESTFWRPKLLSFLDLNRLKGYKFAGDFYTWYMFSKYVDLYIVKSCLGGFRGRKHQLSSQKNKYFSEFYSIAEKRTFLDIMRAYLYIVPHYFFPNKIKRLFNKKIIHYYDGQWMKS
ncbi:MAG: glycosyltransferase [Nitrospirota bacterium]|nr:glycosyltransferase [Nitrospirota bacterium]